MAHHHQNQWLIPSLFWRNPLKSWFHENLYLPWGHSLLWSLVRWWLFFSHRPHTMLPVCTRYPFPFMAASSHSSSFSLKSPNYKPCVIVIFQPPVIPPNFCVDLSSWLIIIIFSTALALFCDDTKIHQDNYFNSLALSPLGSSPLRIFFALPHCYNVFIFSVCVHLDFWPSPPIFITLSLQSFWDLWSIDPITFSAPCISSLHGQSF